MFAFLGTIVAAYGTFTTVTGWEPGTTADWWCGEESLFGCPEWLYPSSPDNVSNQQIDWIPVAAAGLILFIVMRS